MFNGIITRLGVLKVLERAQGNLRLEVCHTQEGQDASMANKFTLAIGDSIAVNGACLTVEECDLAGFKVSLSAQTLSKTTFCQCQEGDRVNLEPALAVGDRVNGYPSTGHIDGIGDLSLIEKSADFYRYCLIFPEDLGRFIVENGTLLVDGVALTINACSATDCVLTIVPHTYQNTIFQNYPLDLKGASSVSVNLEVDIFARYIQSALQNSAFSSQPNRSS